MPTRAFWNLVATLQREGFSDWDFAAPCWCAGGQFLKSIGEDSIYGIYPALMVALGVSRSVVTDCLGYAYAQENYGVTQRQVAGALRYWAKHGEALHPKRFDRNGELL